MIRIIDRVGHWLREPRCTTRSNRLRLRLRRFRFAAPKPTTPPPPALPIFKVFQFPADQIPRIDGKDDDWAIVPDSYAITLADMHDDQHIHAKPDPKDLDIKVKVGWVKGLNRLYFLYEAYDNYWDFADPGLHGDIFELIVDGDRSGGPLIPRFRNLVDSTDDWDAHFSMHGVQAQNYHLMTPAEGKDWAMAWGCQPWDKELPWANHAQTYHFRPGESGHYILEFYITPFDYAGCEGPQRAVESELFEDKVIGLSWAVIDYDGSAGRQEQRLLEPVAGAHYVRPGKLPARVPADAPRTRTAQADRRPLEFQGRRPEAPPRRLPG